MQFGGAQARQGLREEKKGKKKSMCYSFDVKG
jgi:hypothetical protein